MVPAQLNGMAPLGVVVRKTCQASRRKIAQSHAGNPRPNIRLVKYSFLSAGSIREPGGTKATFREAVPAQLGIEVSRLQEMLLTSSQLIGIRLEHRGNGRPGVKCRGAAKRRFVGRSATELPEMLTVIR